DIVGPCRRDGIMSGHDNFIVLTIDLKVTLAPISYPYQPMLGDLRQGKPPDIQAVDDGVYTFLDRKHVRDIVSQADCRCCTRVEDDNNSSGHTHCRKDADNLGGHRTNEPDHDPK